MSRNESAVRSEPNTTILAYYMVVHSLLQQTKSEWSLEEIIQLVNCNFRCPEVSKSPDNELWTQIISMFLFQGQNIRVSTMIDNNGQHSAMFSLEDRETANIETEKNKEKWISYLRPREEMWNMFNKIHHMFVNPPITDITGMMQVAAEGGINPNTSSNQRLQGTACCGRHEGQDLRQPNPHNLPVPANIPGTTIMSSTPRNTATVQQPQFGFPFPGGVYPQNSYPHPGAVTMPYHAQYGAYPPIYDHWRQSPHSRDSPVRQERGERRDRRTEEDYERDRRRSSSGRTRHHSRRYEMEGRRSGRYRSRSRSRSNERYRHRSRSRSDERQRRYRHAGRDSGSRHRRRSPSEETDLEHSPRNE